MTEPRPCEVAYGPHDYHGIDCATPAEWDAATRALRERDAARMALGAPANRASDAADRVRAAVDPDRERREAAKVLHRSTHYGAAAARPVPPAVAEHLADRVEALRRAVHDAGPVPSAHYRTLWQHRGEWPALWRAIDALVGPPPKGRPGR